MKRMNEDRTEILRFDKKEHVKLSPENKGKVVTDTNPYIKINPEAFDLFAEIDPAHDKMAMDCIWPKGMLSFMLKKDETPKLGRTMLRYVPGLMKGMKLEKNQAKRDNRVKVKSYDSLESKLQLKREILDKLAEHDLIGGFTLLDRRYINSELDEMFPYDTVLMIGSEMTRDSIMEIPQPTSQSDKIFDFHVYHNGGLLVDELATFIRGKGVKCRSHVPAKADFSFAPHTVNAGMGNYSTHGLVLTPKWGTSQRFYAITIDLDIPIDNPKDYNFEEFCKRCRMCYKSCPAEAIPRDEQPYGGAVKRRVSGKRCGHNMSEMKFCGVCLKVCPFNNFGYDKCMETLPRYYGYNRMDYEPRLAEESEKGNE